MKNPIMFLLITSVMLSACQHPGQQADKSNVLPIDSVSVVSDNSNEKVILPDTAKIDNILPDSAKIILDISYLAEKAYFSINRDNKSYVEMSEYSLSPYTIENLSKEYSFEILRKLGDLFIENKTPVIISKKELPYHVSAEVPFVEFEIYYNDKIIKNNYHVGEEYINYEYTYSDTFSELFNQLISTAKELRESNEKKQ